MIIPPQCIDTEATLLGACLRYELTPPCSVDDFSIEEHRIIAKSMREIEAAGGKPDLVCVAEKARELSGGSITMVGLTELLELHGSDRNIEAYADIVSQYASLRRVQVKAWNFISECNCFQGKDASSMLSGFCSSVMADSDTKQASRADLNIKIAARAYVSDLDRRMTAGRSIRGIATGFGEYDRATSGLNEQDLVILAARPSAGKTALALAIAKNAAEKGSRVLFYSLEMPISKIMDRLVARDAKIDSNILRDGRLTVEQYSLSAASLQRLSQLDMVFVDTPSTELDIIRKTRRYKPDIVFVDYLQLIIPSRQTGNTNIDVGGISKAMKNLAKEMNIPVVLLSQLTRSNDREARRPRLSDLRDSGQIEQDADVVLFLHYEDGKLACPEREFILAKNRNGQSGLLWNMYFKLEYQDFGQVVTV